VGNDLVVTAFEAEQDAFAALVRGLRPEAWDLPSLCPAWTIRDVVAHVAFHTHRSGMRETLGSTEKHTALLVQREQAETNEGLIEWFISPTPVTAAESKVNLCELVIHQQDVRRVLGAGRGYPEPTMSLCLDYCHSVSGNIFVVGRIRRLTRGLRLVASDMSWARGNGPEVIGTGEAVLMAIAGRSAALADLSGRGVPVLAERFETDRAV
jgi:uncharacterized protein (TIGR03083 family)